MDEPVLAERFVRRHYLSLGLPMPELDELAISDADMDAWRMIRGLVDAGVDEVTVLELDRVSGRGAAQMANVLLQTFTRVFLMPGDTERDFGLRLAEVAKKLGRRSDR